MALASASGFGSLQLDKLSFDADIILPPCPVATPHNGLTGQQFEMPRKTDPKDFVETHFGGSSSSKLHFLKGTTTLAFVYEPATPNDKGGIVVAVDSRATAGKYIATQDVMKVLVVSDHILATMAGGAADCQFWIRLLAKQCKLFELQNKEPISVAAASKLLANMIYGYRGMGLSMGTMVAGWDKKGPRLYYVDDTGVRVQGNLFSCGSGSLNAYGILDTFYKPKMTDKDALELGKRAILHATYRDIGSGGSCNLFHITPTGHKYEGRTDVSEAYYKFMEEMHRETYEPHLSKDSADASKLLFK